MSEMTAVSLDFRRRMSGMTRSGKKILDMDNRKSVISFAELRMLHEAGNQSLNPGGFLSKGNEGLMKLLSGLQSNEGVANPDGRESRDHMEQNVLVGFEKFPVFEQRKKFESKPTLE